MPEADQSKGKPGRKLSRLEFAVLGLISRGAPCTAYWIRRQFLGSLSSYFSGSAGAVYPVVHRLEAQSLVRAQAAKSGKRQSLQYRITQRGQAVLRDWLLPPLPAEDAAFSMDPVRTRVYYLGCLTPTERRRFVEEALDQARARVDAIESESEAARAGNDVFDHLGGLGVLYEARARVAWLEELQRELSRAGAKR